MHDPLEDYRDKRDFARTPEPPPALAAPDAGPRPWPVFVVHRHEARNLHYDLRLEAGGVLCSFAVPKGFSFDPTEKRLAVRTEDHPLAYEHFSGRIPRGHYGAGTMTIWDHGRYELLKAVDWPAAILAGEIKLRLFGRRLRGEWHLVRTKQGPNTWLLFKARDDYAGPTRDSALGFAPTAAPEAPMPDSLPLPMTCGSTGRADADSDWLFEVEFHGQRLLAAKDRDEVRLPAELPALPRLRADLRRLSCERALLDGVLVALDAAQRPCRRALATALANGGNGVVYYAFDLLHWDDYDLRPLPLLERKAALRAIVPPTGSVLFVDHVPGNGPDLLVAIAGKGLPGAIRKRARSAYTSGPSLDWVRVPADPTAAAVAAAPRVAGAVTNPGKVYWPIEGYTKADLIAYYEQVADVLLPHLRDRPVHLNRFPDGIDGKSFYQRQAADGTPEWVATLPIGTGAEVVSHHLIQDRRTLRYVANLGSIDLHPWLSRHPTLDQPDHVVLDLDPKSAPFADVLRIARAAGRLLRGVGLRPLVKTSGKTGLHVFVAVLPGYSYEQTRQFAEIVARLLVRELPDIATVERLPHQRDGKVYIDFLQNRRSQTVVPPYSVRPVRGATVSTPLHWDELEDVDLRPLRFTIKTVPDRIREHGDLFAPVLHDRHDLLPAIEQLAAVLRSR